MRQNVAAAVLALSWLPAAALATGTTAPAIRHVVLVSVDGLRPDAIDPARARRLQSLRSDSVYSAAGRTVGSPVTLPSHVSMVTGLKPGAHGVTYNEEEHDGKLSSASVFTRVQDAGGKTMLLFSKGRMVILAGKRGADVAQGPGEGNRNWDAGSDAALALRFAAEFSATRPMFSMVTLRAPDHVGHKKRWMSEAYFRAVRESDAALGTILDAIDASPLKDATAVLLTADHGGEGKRHFEGSEASEIIPWLCRVPGVKPRALRGTVRTVDIAPTALALLGLPPLEGIDGRVVEDCLPRAGATAPAAPGP